MERHTGERAARDTSLLRTIARCHHHNYTHTTEEKEVEGRGRQNLLPADGTSLIASR